MKKILTFLFASLMICSSITIGMSRDISSWGEDDAASSARYPYFYRMDFELNSPWLQGNGGIGSHAALNNMEITFSNKGYSSDEAAPLSVAIFEIGSSFTCAGKADNIYNERFVSETNVRNFDFTNLVLDAEKDYTLVFVGDMEYFNNLQIGDTRSSLYHDGQDTNSPFRSVGLTIKSNSEGRALFSSVGLDMVNGIVPVIKLNVEPVPEPSAAALGLLSLAGFCFRRKRHC